MHLLQAIIFGIVEGITEFLPVSSTGHLMLTARLLGLSQTEFLKTFEIVIQFGAILSIIVLYWKTILVKFEVIKRIMTAFVPTAILGVIFYRFIKHFLMGSTKVVLWSLFVGGLCLIVFEIIHREKHQAIEDLSTIPYITALWIGFFQSIAMIPGVSRSAATIVGGLILGLKRKTIVEFSFLLAVPTILSATLLDLVKNIDQFSAIQINFLTSGFVFSFIFALLSVKFLLNFIRSHSFISFGIYRIIAALTFWWFIK